MNGMDGLWRIANGKHSVIAWKEFLAAADLSSLEGEQQVVQTDGLQVNLVYYPENSPDDIKVEQGVAHDLESSSHKFRQTSLQSKFEIIQAARAKVPGEHIRCRLVAFPSFIKPQNLGFHYCFHLGIFNWASGL